MRVQVNIGPDTVKRIDKLAKEVGVTRSALCSLLIFQSLPADDTGVEQEELTMLLNEKITDREIEKAKLRARPDREKKA